MLPGRRLPRLTLTRAARLLAAGHVTSEELCLYCHSLAVAGEDQWQLNAFTHLMPIEDLLEKAKASDARRRAAPGGLSPLEGIPVSIKANLAVSREPLTAASRILGSSARDIPCGYNADAVDSLLRCGAVLVGITNMDEFGMGSLGTNVASSSRTGASITRNPTPSYLRRLQLGTSRGPIEDEDIHLAELIRTPMEDLLEAHSKAAGRDDEPLWSAGGSSCGSAVSVAHGSSLVSLGTDTGGSVRLPAAWCGVVGLKPSYGLISRHGVVSYASSLDTVGILAPSVSCAAVVLDNLAQRNSVDQGSRDSTSSYYATSVSLTHSVETIVGVLDTCEESKALSGMKLGLPAAFSVAECPPHIHEAWARGAEILKQHGASVQTISTDLVSPKIVQNSLAAYYVLACAEASSNLSRYDGLRYGFSADMDQPSDGPWESENEVTSDTTPLERQFSATRSQGFGSEVIRRILCGTSVLSSDRFHTHYEAAARLRAVITRQLLAALKEVDLLLIPTALSLPWSLDDPPDSTEMFANDVMTIPISLAGLPAVSVPVALSPEDGKSHSVAGLQLVGSRLAEGTVLKAAKVIEQASGL